MVPYVVHLLTVITPNWMSLWRHQMEAFSALQFLCAGNPPVAGGFPAQRDSDADLWCFFVVHRSKLLQTLGWPVIRDAMMVIWLQGNGVVKCVSGLRSATGTRVVPHGSDGSRQSLRPGEIPSPQPWQHSTWMKQHGTAWRNPGLN